MGTNSQSKFFSLSHVTSVGNPFPLFFLLAIPLFLTSCNALVDPDSVDTRLTKLTAKYEHLQEDYKEIRTQLEALDANFHAQDSLVLQENIKPTDLVASREILKRIRDRGTLRCGSSARELGFGRLDPTTGIFEGFYIDFCRAIAIAIFGQGQAGAAKIIPITIQNRFAALQSGEIDILLQNITWTFDRDAALGFEFGPIVFYDGQGMMVPVNSNIDELEDLAGHAICTMSDTTSFQNVVEYFAKLNMQVEVKGFDNLMLIRTAYEGGNCTGLTLDKSGLLGQKIQLSEPKDHKILSENMSREPLAPVIRQGDNNWFDVIFWTIQCTINAEYFGINQNNIAGHRNSEHLDIQKLLGEEGKLGQGLSLKDDFCYQVIAEVGNYADIYDRHFGFDTAFKLPRGLNAIFNEDGLLYPIPFR